MIVVAFIPFYSCSCKEDKECVMEGVFLKMVNSMDKRKLDQFKNSNFDSTCDLFQLISEEMTVVYKDVSKSKQLCECLDTIPLLRDSLNRITYLTVAFHDFLIGDCHIANKEEDQLRKILDLRWNCVLRENGTKNELLASRNFNSVKIGDSIVLILPVKREESAAYTFFKGGYPYSYDYSTADDSLIINVLVIDKFQGERTGLSPVNAKSLNFRVKIIKTSDSGVEVRADDRSGDEFSFCLQLYGRKIGTE